MKKSITFYVMDYQNGNKRIEKKEIIRNEEKKFILTEQYTPEQLKEIKKQYNDFNKWIEHEIDKNISMYLKGIIELDRKPDWNDLIYDNETETYFLKTE